MLNRYQGNSGRVQRIEESAAPPKSPPAPPGRERQTPPSLPRPAKTPSPLGELSGALGGIGERLSKLIPTDIGQLETEDIILLLILYLMYRESGDSELLIIMGAMFLL